MFVNLEGLSSRNSHTRNSKTVDIFVNVFDGIWLEWPAPNSIMSTLTCIGVNARSIVGKIMEILNLLKKEKVDIMFLCETWLSEDIRSSSLNLPNYTIIRRDRKDGRTRGGVAILIKKEYEVKDRPDLQENDIEAVVVELAVGRTSIILCSFYKSEIVTSTERMVNFLSNLFTRTRGKQVIVSGDLNENLLVESGGSRSVKDMMTTFGITQHIRTHTRTEIDQFLGISRNSLLDVMFTSQSHRVKHTEVLYKYPISDHYPICIKYESTKPNIERIKHRSRNFKAANIERFRRELEAEMPAKIVGMENLGVEEAERVLSSALSQSAETNFPVCEFSVGSKDVPNISNLLLTMIDEKYVLLNRYEEVKSDENRRAFNRQSRLVRKRSIRERMDFLHQEIREKARHTGAPQSSSKPMWDTLNTHLPIKAEKKDEEIELEYNGLVVKDQVKVANIFNEHFTSVGRAIERELPPPTVDPVTYMVPPMNNMPNFTVRPITADIVTKYMNRQSASKSSADCVPFRIIKKTFVIFVMAIVHVINASFRDAFVPVGLKTATVTPLHKSGPKTLRNNFRPISVLPFVTKTMEYHMHNELAQYLDEKGVLYEKQAAYRQHHNTEMLVNHLTSQVYGAWENSQPVCVVFIDLKKAFDTVPVDILLRKLHFYGVRGDELKWFESLLTGRKQRTRASGGAVSDLLDIDIGVPQGSALGPLLFTLFMNDLFAFSGIPETLLYADDTALVFSGEMVNSEVINNCLARLKTWMEANRMTLNASKTKLMNFSGPAMVDLLLRIGDDVIVQVESYRYLGVVLDPKLSFCDHIQSVVNKVNRLNGIIFKNRSFLPIEICEILINSLVIPTISYADTVYQNASYSNLAKIDKSFRMVLRSSYRFPLGIPTSEIYNRTKFLPLLLQRQISSTKFAMKIVSGHCAEFLKRKINYVDYNVIRQRPARQVAVRQDIFSVPTHIHRTSTNSSYLVWGPKTLNLIPRQIIEEASIVINPSKHLGKRLKMALHEWLNSNDWSREIEATNRFITM